MLDYFIQFWEIFLIVFVILLELVTRRFDKNRKTKNVFSYQTMPVLRPVRIPTAGKGLAESVWVWLTKSRRWELVEDFHYTLNNENYIIPQGFVCDCTSIPRFLQNFLSPTGILLIGGLVHDYGYRYTTLRLTSGEDSEPLSQKELDKIFRDINIQVNGFRAINFLPYYMLRTFGWIAWWRRRLL